MAEPFAWSRAFSRLRYAHPEAALRDIAAHLHHAANYGDGRTEPEVLILLAEMIDPDCAKPVAGPKLVLKREKRPPVLPNYELRRFLEDGIDVQGKRPDDVYADAQKAFGVSRRECERQLSVMREWRASEAKLTRTLARLGLR